MENQDKKALIQSVAKEIAASVQAASQSLQRAIGAKAILQDSVIRLVDESKEEWSKKYESRECSDEDIFVVNMVIDSLRSKANSLLEESVTNIGVASGQLLGFSRALQALEQRFDEATKAESPKEGEVSLEENPQHPGPGIAAERKAELVSPFGGNKVPAPVEENKKAAPDNVSRLSSKSNKNRR